MRARPAADLHVRMIFERLCFERTLRRKKAMNGESTSAPATTATRPSDPLDVIWLDVPAGHIENDSDHYHVLDMHAGDPVRMSCRLDGHHSRGAQFHGDINVLPAGATARWFFGAQTSAVLLRLSPKLFLSLRELAEVAGFSVTHFKVLFTQATGFAVHSYVVERRVERARQLLLRGEHPLADIALESGFAHQSHMNRYMYRLLGMNPGQLITLCRK
jgi:AraC-like DNA-binding protein